MRVLLDTRVWLWATGASSRLGRRTRALLVDRHNEVCFSHVSAWELAIKAGRHGLDLGEDVADYVRSRLARQGLRELPIRLDHVLAVAHLPPHHRDPFDRLLVAQAQAEGLTLVSADDRLRAYDVPYHDAHR